MGTDQIKHIGLSEPTLDEIRRALTVCKIDNIQVEFSLLSRGIENNGILDFCKKNGIQVVAYSPVARGLLSESMTDKHRFSEDNYRTKMVPYFNELNYKKNVALRNPLDIMARQKKCSSAQLALRWILAKGIIPISASNNMQHLLENIKAQELPLTKKKKRQY